MAEIRAVVDDAGPALDEALRAGLLELDGEVARLGHPLVGAASVGRATLERRRAIHARLAPLAGDPEARARHLALAAAGPDEVAAAACTAAADDAERRGAATAAAELAELAVRLTASDDTPPWPPAAAGPPRSALPSAIRTRRGGTWMPASRSRRRRARGSRCCSSASSWPTSWAGDPRRATPPSMALAAAGNDPILRARAHAAMLAWGAEDTAEERRHAAAALDLLADRESEAPEAAADATRHPRRRPAGLR